MHIEWKRSFARFFKADRKLPIIIEIRWTKKLIKSFAYPPFIGLNASKLSFSASASLLKFKLKSQQAIRGSNIFSYNVEFDDRDYRVVKEKSITQLIANRIRTRALIHRIIKSIANDNYNYNNNYIENENKRSALSL